MRLVSKKENAQSVKRPTLTDEGVDRYSIIMTAAKDKNSYKRKNIRFKADLNATAWIDMNEGHEAYSFKPTVSALVANEAFMGAGLIVKTEAGIKEGDWILAKVGEIGPIRAQVKWVHMLDGEIARIGIQYEK